MALLRT